MVGYLATKRVQGAGQEKGQGSEAQKETGLEEKEEEDSLHEQPKAGGVEPQASVFLADLEAARSQLDIVEQLLKRGQVDWLEVSSFLFRVQSNLQSPASRAYEIWKERVEPHGYSCEVCQSEELETETMWDC